MTKLNLPLSPRSANATLGCKSNEQIYANQFCVPTANFCSSEVDCPKGSQCIDGVCQCTPNAGMYLTLVPAPFNVYSMGCSWNEKVDRASCHKHEYGAEKICLLNYCSKEVPCFAGVCDEDNHVCTRINATRVPLPKPSHPISIAEVPTPPPTVDTGSSTSSFSPVYITLIAAFSVVGLMFVACIIRSVLLCCRSSARWAFGARKGVVKLTNEDTSADDYSGNKEGNGPSENGAAAAAAAAPAPSPVAHQTSAHYSPMAYPPTPLSGTTLATTSPSMSRAPSRASGLLPPSSPLHAPMYSPNAQQNYSRHGSAMDQQVRRSFHNSHDAGEHQEHMVTIELQDQSGWSTPPRMPPSSPLNASYPASVAGSMVDIDSGVAGIATKEPLMDDSYTTIELNDRMDQQDPTRLHATTATSNPIRRSLSTPSFQANGAAKGLGDETRLSTDKSRPVRDSCTLPGHAGEGDSNAKQQQLHRSSTTIPTLTMTPAPGEPMNPKMMGPPHPTTGYPQHHYHPRNSRLMPATHPHPQQQQQPNDRTLRHFQSTPNIHGQHVGGANQPYYGPLEPPRPAFAPRLRASTISQRPLSTASVTPEARHLPPGFASAPIARSPGVLNPTA